MARPSRNNVDYFPFLCKEGKAMYYIETTYGNDGYATWVKMLRELAVANFHYLDLSDKVNVMFLASKCKVTQELLLKILDDLADLGEINTDLWTGHRVIWNQKFIDHIQDAYNKRSNTCIDLDGLRVLLTSLGVLKPGKVGVSAPVNPQSKEEYTKEEEKKEDNTNVASAPLDQKQKSKVEEHYSIVSEVIAYLNECSGKEFKPGAAKNRTPIIARINEGFVLSDFKAVIEIMTKKWLNSDYNQYLRPETLFGPKMDGYRNITVTETPKQTTGETMNNAFEIFKQQQR